MEPLYEEDIIYYANDFAERFNEEGFDFTMESLKRVDDYLDDLSCFGLDDRSLENAAVTVGCYISETARRCFGGEYKWSESDEQPVLVAGLPDFSVAVKTWDKALMRLKNGNDDSIFFYISGFKEHIEIGKKTKGYNVLLV